MSVMKTTCSVFTITLDQFREVVRLIISCGEFLIVLINIANMIVWVSSYYGIYRSVFYSPRSAVNYVLRARTKPSTKVKLGRRSKMLKNNYSLIDSYNEIFMNSYNIHMLTINSA